MPFDGSISPSGNLGENITPSNDFLIPRPRSLYVDTGGTMDYVNGDGTTVTDRKIYAGTTLPFQPLKILALNGGAAVAAYHDGAD